MKIKFKDGITIEVSDTKGKNQKEIIAEAKEIHNEFIKDAKLRRTFYTNTAFSATEIKEAIAEGDWRKLDKELKLLDRDIDADIRRNQNYTERYSKDQLKKIIKAYDDVVAQLRRIEDNETYANKANELEGKINTLKENWSINDSKTVKDTVMMMEDMKEGQKAKLLEEIPYDYYEEQKEICEEFEENFDDAFIKKTIDGEDWAVIPKGAIVTLKYEIGPGGGNPCFDVNGVELDFGGELNFKVLLLNDSRPTKDSKSVKDVPPYYDPSVTVGETATNYSASRVEKADRYNDVTMLEVEFDGIIQDLEEYIQDTTPYDDPNSILHTFRKDELRQITSKYYEMANIYKKNGLNNQADAIKSLTDTLYQRWHLGV